MKNFSLAIAGVLVLLAAGYYLWGLFEKNSENTRAQDEFFQRGEGSGSDAVPESGESSGQAGGLQIQTVKSGTGPGAKDGDLVTVHYVGTLENGQKFDSSRDRGTPFALALGEHRVIPGWELGLQGMKAGEIRRLTIPPELAYGAAGTPGGPIPPNATLVFEVELLKISESPAP